MSKSPVFRFLDIETSPILGFTWATYDTSVLKVLESSKIISVSWKDLGSEATEVKCIADYDNYKSNIVDDEELVKEAWNVLDESDIICAHYGDAFDLKKLNARFAYYGLNAPSSYASIDTKKVASKYFKFDSNSLNNLGAYLNVGQKINNGGFDLWVRCMAGDLSAWETMKAYNCLVPSHKLLGNDLRWKPISDYRVGDTILGFDEIGPYRKYRNSIITKLDYDYKTVYRVTLSSGKFFDVTSDHKWLVVNSVHDRIGGFKWKATEELFINGKNLLGKTTTSKYQTDIVPKLFNQWEEDYSKDAGWLAGMYDGEGCVYNGKKRNGGAMISITQKEGPELDRIRLLTDKFSTEGYYTHKGEYGTGSKIVRVTQVKGNVSQRLEFLGRIRPERLIAKVDFNRTGRVEARNGVEKIVSIEEVGVKEIAILGTSTRTFIADGYPMHNCQDVNLLEQVYLKLRPFMANHPDLTKIVNISAETSCSSCLSTNLTKRGFSLTKLGRKQRYQCSDCGSWSVGMWHRDREITEDDPDVS